MPANYALGPVIVDIAGVSLCDEDVEILSHPFVGGIILFTRNFENIHQLKNLVADIRKVSPRLLIAVDHEGGRVQRFKKGFTRIPPMQSFLAPYRKDASATLEKLEDTGWLMAAELLQVGIDITFAPVLDVDDSFSSIIGDRAFSPDPHEVVAMASALIDGMHAAGMKVTGKHFPGHGSVKGDSHLELPVDERTMNEVKTHDLIPFESLLNKCDALMPAHIVFSKVDKHPVGFSDKWINQILRTQMQYDGVVFSDDLSMEGAAIAGGYSARAEFAMQAGCDSVLVCNNREGAKEVIKTLSAMEPTHFTDRLISMCANFETFAFDDLFAQPRWLKTKDFLSQFI